MNKHALAGDVAFYPRKSFFRTLPGGRTAAERGQTSVEFAMFAPVLLTILMLIAVFGIAFDHYIALTFATNAGAQQLSISRGQTTDPCATASQAVYSAAPQLSQSSLQFSMVLAGKAVSGTSCSGSQQYLVQSQPASVTVTYPCNLQILGFNPAPNCALTAQSTVFIQ